MDGHADLADDAVTDAAAGRDRYQESVLSHELPAELRRLRLLERMCDAQTWRVLQQCDIGPQWRCLELGAGAGSVARGLAAHCPDGHVVATDTDTRFLNDSPAGNLRVREHNVAEQDFEPASFELIHARWLLEHLPQRESVLRRAASWLAPGGWLVIEDIDLSPADSSPHPAWRKLLHAFEQLLSASHGADARWARSRLPAALADAGLVDIGMSVSPAYIGDGGVGEQWARVYIEQAEQAFVDSGLLAATELVEALALLDEPGFIDVPLATISAWGRRPA